MIHLTIPIANKQELYAYQKGILSILNRIDIYTCDKVLMKDVKAVYRLLDFLIQNSHISDFAKTRPTAKEGQI